MPHAFTIGNVSMTALPSGALWLRHPKILVVSDLHLGKSERQARWNGVLLPPYEVTETLTRLAEDIAREKPEMVICLGDSFDDLETFDAISPAHLDCLHGLMAGREWIWIEGNHDPGPVDMGGSHLSEFRWEGITFRHIADPKSSGEVSGHYHPKFHVLGIGRRRPAFLYDMRRLILPAYGHYTGGMRAEDPTLRNLFSPSAFAVLTGSKCRVVPFSGTGSFKTLPDEG